MGIEASCSACCGQGCCTGSPALQGCTLAAVEGLWSRRLSSRLCSSSPGSSEVMHPHDGVSFLVAKSSPGCKLIHASGQQVWLSKNTEQLMNTQSKYMVLADKTDISHSYDIVLKYAKTPSWCIRTITTVFPGAGSHLKGRWVWGGGLRSCCCTFLCFIWYFF